MPDPADPSAHADALHVIVSHLPTQPGVYRMWDEMGQLLYIGKAKNLRKRVKSYFQQRDHSARIEMMVAQIASIDTIVTPSERDAFLLEAAQINTLQPKFNILLRHDPHYPWLAFTNEPFSRLVVTRKPASKFFKKTYGPYPSAGAMYETLKVIKKIFPLRQRQKPLFKSRPCMNYHIGQCLAPCVEKVSAEDYEAMVAQVDQFLKGRVGEVVKRLEAEMQSASDVMAFEQAALLRDRLKAVESVVQQQRMIVNDPTLDQDVVAGVLHPNRAWAQITVMIIRAGKLINTHYFKVQVPSQAEMGEVLESFIAQYYASLGQDPERLPKAIIGPMPLQEEALLLDSLSALKGQSVRYVVPQQPNKKNAAPQWDWLQMATQNAEEALKREALEQQSALYRDPVQALMGLQEALALPQFPKRMECFDISHISGTQTVASMVVFTDGLPDKAAYRKFTIKSLEHGKPDDFKSMHEVMTRRFSKQGDPDWPDPDLVIIDGGKGQLSSAVSALKALGIDQQPIISLAKQFEEVFLPGESRPVLLERESPALQLLQHIRDEAHRFAITFHRQKRAKQQTQSYLDGVSGIGPTRKQRLLEAYPTKKKLQAASLQDIAHVTQTTGKTAQRLYEILQAL